MISWALSTSGNSAIEFGAVPEDNMSDGRTLHDSSTNVCNEYLHKINNNKIISLLLKGFHSTSTSGSDLPASIKLPPNKGRIDVILDMTGKNIVMAIN